MTEDAESSEYLLLEFLPANQQLSCINEDTGVLDVLSEMTLNGYSQLPVKNKVGFLVGVVDWRSIAIAQAKMLHRQLGSLVAIDLLEPHQSMQGNRSLFEAIPLIYKYNYILVMDEQNYPKGIVTSADLCNSFHNLTHPFLMIEEIESHLRKIVAKYFSIEEMEGVASLRRKVREDGAGALMFGEYRKLICQEEGFSRLNAFVSRNAFCNRLDDVRRVRNEIMHFSHSSSEETVCQLTNFRDLLKRMY